VTLRVPPAAEPSVSIVMVTYGAWHLAQTSLRAVVAHTPEPYEVIVVDNGSSDETVARLAELEGAKVIFNPENRGFGPASNQGAEAARGRNVVFLNSDAIVSAGWLGPLLETLESAAWVGAVVPRFLHEDGSLQEAGALLGQDGTVLTYGDRDRPERLRYRFRRVVDFGGGACMLVRRADFKAVGGFDPQYAPAYYEDADLCFRLALHGRLTMYEPRAMVTHVRYGSGGLARAAELSARNRAQFVSRWHEQLRGRPATLERASERDRLYARDAQATERILVVDGAAATRGGEPPGASMVSTLAAGWPRARISWLIAGRSEEAFDLERWLGRGVELVDEPSAHWLAERPLFYDAVIDASSDDAGLRRQVRSSQPQAMLFDLNDLEPDVDLIGARLADAGIPPSPATDPRFGVRSFGP